MEAILYIGHGTRSNTGVQKVQSFIQRVMKRVDVPIQELSFLELTSPSVQSGFQNCVNRGATEITIVPLFLLAAGHIKKDIPEILSTLKQSYPKVEVHVRDPFGVQEGILDAIAELVRQTVGHIERNDAILIVGRGSSDKSIHGAFAEIASGIGERLAVSTVLVCYLAAADPKFKTGLEIVSSETEHQRIIVIPYLLFPGLLLSEIEQEVKQRQMLGQRIKQTRPLTEHMVIEDIVVRCAMGGRHNS